MTDRKNTASVDSTLYNFNHDKFKFDKKKKKGWPYKWPKKIKN